MKRKIKIIFGFAATLLPYIALAQVTTPSGTGLQQGTIMNIIKSVMMWLLGLLGFFAIIGFVISGIMYLVAAGDEDQQSRAKKAMFYSITGVIVGLVGLVIFVAVQSLTSGSNTNF
jgi:hypothetical protein